MPLELRKGKLFYHRLPDFARKEDKLNFLSDRTLRDVNWRFLVPNTKHTWLRSDTEDEFDSYLPIGSKDAKKTKTESAGTVFKTYSGGVVTRRDVYIYDFNHGRLSERMKRFVGAYNAQVAVFQLQSPKLPVDDFVDYNIVKWDSALKRSLVRGKVGTFRPRLRKVSLYRPFAKYHLYFDKLLVSAVCLQHRFFPNEQAETENLVVSLTDKGSEKPFLTMICQHVSDAHLVGAGSSAQCFPFYTYDADGSNRRENITDYALDQFREHYNDPAISKWGIFYYVYGLLHHPGYRERYALDLKRNLPRIPFAPSPPEASDKGSAAGREQSSPQCFGGNEGGRKIGFYTFYRAGKQLAELHLNYESVERYHLDWQATRQPISHRVEKMQPKGKVDSSAGNYKVYETLKYNDSLTLHGIPERAFAYRLGNRSALDWIVDQYRVKTDRRSGITHDPNGYSDDPQYILKLIERVITVSLRTVDIVEALAKLPFRAEPASE